MTKLTLEQQELLFANDCKLINLRYEYHGYTGTEKWAIVTELAEEELWVKYPDVIRRYTPFILLSMAQGEVIDESYRNNDKYEKRAKRTIDVYGYEDDISEQFHRELITPFVDPFEQAEEERIEEEKEQLRQLEIAKVRKVLEMLKPVQRERLIKAILLGMSSRKIAKEEGVFITQIKPDIERDLIVTASCGVDFFTRIAYPPCKFGLYKHMYVLRVRIKAQPALFNILEYRGKPVYYPLRFVGRQYSPAAEHFGVNDRTCYILPVHAGIEVK